MRNKIGEGDAIINPRPSAYLLSLVDGTRLTLLAEDAGAETVMGFWAHSARLSPTSNPVDPLSSGDWQPGKGRCLRVVTGVLQDSSQGMPHAKPRYVSPVPIPSEDALCLLTPVDAPPIISRRRPAFSGPPTKEQWFWQQLTRLSACIGREAQRRGGVLLHSGLAACTARSLEEKGILLAGRSGVGKSTAARRLPPSWCALSDDMTLVVRDEGGHYLAHPFPTWSCFFGEERGDGSDTWDVQQAVPLQAIFILEQGEQDRVEPMGAGHGLCLLTELAREPSKHFEHNFSIDDITALNLQRFENLCALVQAIPAYLLHVTRHGAFWDVIEEVLWQG